MALKTKLLGYVYEFKSIREIMVRVNEERPGDRPTGITAETAGERVTTKVALSNLTLDSLHNCPATPYEEDEVIQTIQDSANEAISNEYKNTTVAEFHEWLLNTQTAPDMTHRAPCGLTSEIVVDACKLMSNLDLICIAKRMCATAHCDTTVGLPDTFSSRLQSNHTTDDPNGIVAFIMEGLSLDCGDAAIGLNPVNDSVESVARILKVFGEFKRKREVSTRIYMLAHMTTQAEATNEFGAPLDLMLQFTTDSQKGNEAFDLNAAMLDEGCATTLFRGTCAGPNIMYFETGRGSGLPSEVHNDWNQAIMEVCYYGFTERYSLFLVNTVISSIGPEYPHDSKQVTRVGLEDHFMGKLTGIPTGCDACYTNHMKADQNDTEDPAALLIAAGYDYIMGVSEGDDCMLMYQYADYHKAAALRGVFDLRPIHEFDMWLKKMGLSENGKLTPRAGDVSVFLKK